MCEHHHLDRCDRADRDARVRRRRRRRAVCGGWARMRRGVAAAGLCRLLRIRQPLQPEFPDKSGRYGAFLRITAHRYRSGPPTCETEGRRTASVSVEWCTPRLLRTQRYKRSVQQHSATTAQSAAPAGTAHSALHRTVPGAVQRWYCRGRMPQKVTLQLRHCLQRAASRHQFRRNALPTACRADPTKLPLRRVPILTSRRCAKSSETCSSSTSHSPDCGKQC